VFTIVEEKIILCCLRGSLFDDEERKKYSVTDWLLDGEALGEWNI
jgi:hypothetical protein